MAGVLDKIRKRMRYPVTLPNGETIHIRQLSFGEQVRAEALDGTTRVGFLIGSAIVEDDGQLAYAKAEKESDTEFGDRVAMTTELDSMAFNAIQDAIRKLEKRPSQEVLLKNSDETSTQT